MQDNVNVSIAYGPELVAFGTSALVGSGKLLRRVGSTLSMTKDSFSSNEVRPEQQVFDARHGMRRVGGGLEVELSTQSFDDFLEALLRGTWTAGVTSTEATLTSVAADNATSKFTFGGGNPITVGMKVGDTINFTNLAVAGNNSKNFRITGFSGVNNRDVAVTPAPTTMTADTAFNVAVRGSKLVMGTTKRSFTIEQKYQDIDVSELFTGCRIGSGAFRMPPNGMATATFDILGQNGQALSGAGSPFFTAPTAAPTTGLMTGTQGALRVAGQEIGIVTSLDFSLSCNLSSTPVIGTDVTPDVFYGNSVLNGNVSAYLENDSFLQAFANETEIDIVAVLEASGVEPLPFLSFNMQRVKLMGGISKNIAQEGGVVISMPFQALLAVGGSGTAYDASTLVIQRSN